MSFDCFPCSISTPSSDIALSCRSWHPCNWWNGLTDSEVQYMAYVSHLSTAFWAAIWYIAIVSMPCHPVLEMSVCDDAHHIFTPATSQKVFHHSGSLLALVTNIIAWDRHNSHPVMNHPPSAEIAQYQSPCCFPHLQEPKTLGKTYVVYIPDINCPPEVDPCTQHHNISPARGKWLDSIGCFQIKLGVWHTG